MLIAILQHPHYMGQNLCCLVWRRLDQFHHCLQGFFSNTLFDSLQRPHYVGQDLCYLVGRSLDQLTHGLQRLASNIPLTMLQCLHQEV